MSKKESYYDGAPAEIINTNDLRTRTLYLQHLDAFSFPEFKASPDGETKPIPNSDRNRSVFFDVLFDHGSGVVSHPYFDTFRGRAVDHVGEPISEFNSHADELAACLKLVKMTNQNYETLDKSFERWAKKHHRNSLIKNVQDNTPEWDNKKRTEEYLIELFKLQNNETNRKLNKYFWLSLYNRIFNPGCQAPISIALIGHQGVGKSYFSVALCQLLIGSPHAAPTALSLNDIERNTNDWLRRITGNSIIANIGEMKGFKKADIETIKEFMTRTVDNVHHKYQQGLDMPRQWVIVMDGNSYDGFFRDETGNRRFFPFFVNQIDDVDGQPMWYKGDDWKADFSTFSENVWQIMAECQEWFDDNGQDGYNNFVGECSKLVSNFSAAEVAAGRGIIRDETTEAALHRIMLSARYEEVRGRKNDGMFVTNTELSEQWNKRQKGSINFAAVKRLLISYGYEQLLIPPYGRGYLLRGSEDAFAAKKHFFYRNVPKDSVDAFIGGDDVVQSAIQSAMKENDGF